MIRKQLDNHSASSNVGNETVTQSNGKTNQSVSSLNGTATPLLTLFAIPKKFEGESVTHQSNAIRSWARLAPHVEILLFSEGDDPLLENLAEEIDAQIIPIVTSEIGTPLLNDAFQKAHQIGRGQLFCYANCDIIFNDQLLRVAHGLIDDGPDSFLAIGQRTELAVSEALDLNLAATANELFDRASSTGRLDSIVCKDYFLFTRDLFQQMPEFRVGRGNWDNWMVVSSKIAGLPVIDVSPRILAIHQRHGYGHLAGGRRTAYVTGDEARTNQKLAGGRNLVSGSTATWIYGSNGLRKKRIPAWAMVRDMPRFMLLLRNLLFLGYMMPAYSLLL